MYYNQQRAIINSNFVMEILTTFLSVSAIIISILAWHKNRVIYEIVIEDDKSGGIDKVNDLLRSQKYTIVNVKQDAANNARTIYVLGKIKK